MIENNDDLKAFELELWGSPPAPLTTEELRRVAFYRLESLKERFPDAGARVLFMRMAIGQLSQADLVLLVNLQMERIDALNAVIDRLEDRLLQQLKDAASQQRSQ